MDSKIIQLDDLILDRQRRQVKRSGEIIRMPALSYDTLLALALAAPNTISIQSLIDQVWPGTVVSDETVTQRIKLLRQALNDNSRAPRYIDSRTRLPADSITETRP